ncbi:MAG: hypothetical protein HYZ71_08595 [Deltaproteobacteria bacterium]|nr:hypothetical protein [Deltaproteobacteria bacterium]
METTLGSILALVVTTISWADSRPSRSFDPLGRCFVTMGYFAESVHPSNGSFRFVALTSLPGDPTINVSVLSGMKIQYAALRLLQGGRFNFDDKSDRADFYDWLSAQPALKNAGGLNSANTRNGWKRRPEAAATSYYYLRGFLKHAADRLRLEQEEGQSDRNFGLGKAREILRKAAATAAERAWARFILSNAPESSLTVNEQSLAKTFFYTGQNRRAHFIDPVATNLPPTLRKDLGEALEFLELARERGNQNLLALSRELYTTLSPQSSIDQVTEFVVHSRRYLYPEIAKIISPAELMQSPELVRGWLTVHTESSTGLVAGRARGALRSPDGKVSIAVQQLPDGRIRLEGFRVTNPGQAAVPFAFEADPRGKGIKEEDVSRCVSCHMSRPGSIDLRARGVQDVRSLMAQARAEAGGERATAVLTTDNPMKRAEATSPQARQIRNWFEPFHLK